ncbi:hypothetical protein MUP32_02345 [Candidatus Microgenomates bacterium]|nr:hypothetical protein [Candidatus Microgenomates bacterium]
MFRGIEGGQFARDEALTGRDGRLNSLADLSAGVIFMSKLPDNLSGMTMNSRLGAGASRADRTIEDPKKLGFIKTIDYLRELHPKKGKGTKEKYGEYVDALIAMSAKLFYEQTMDTENKYTIKTIAYGTGIKIETINSRRDVLVGFYCNKYPETQPGQSPFDAIEFGKIKHRGKVNIYNAYQTSMLLLHFIVAFPNELTKTELAFARELWPQHLKGIEIIQERLEKPKIKKVKAKGVNIQELVDVLHRKPYQIINDLRHNERLQVDLLKLIPSGKTIQDAVIPFKLKDQIIAALQKQTGS